MNTFEKFGNHLKMPDPSRVYHSRMNKLHTKTELEIANKIHETIVSAAAAAEDTGTDLWHIFNGIRELQQPHTDLDDFSIEDSVTHLDHVKFTPTETTLKWDDEGDYGIETQILSSYLFSQQSPLKQSANYGISHVN